MEYLKLNRTQNASYELILMMDKISSGLHGVEIKLNTTQSITVWNVFRMQIIPELSSEDGQFQLLYILFLVLMASVKYRFKHL